ncbi:MAG: hypothetical protein HN967_11810 [Candidatus Marinimicrobia bacterium]|nr:hypothetical protein [Candidatus Neomarinimicrobiota bacterium]MBT4538419.1 hypothetical protein [Candidatus Neomarinimicrobiota bacterium]MBT7021817.1 hypothetical protein [Candidatus Neomarinimicrobiota bacterium]
MSKYINIIYLVIFIIISSLSYSQDLYNPYHVNELNIEFYNPDYDSILQDRWEIDDKSYLLATITINGQEYDSVGVRYKGNSTFYWAQETNNPKMPFNIDIDLVHDDQNINGYNKLKLSNALFDITYVKEPIGYITEGLYLPTSEAGYMDVSVDGEHLGLYVNVESVNRQFLSKHFGNNDGTFFKCEPQYHYGDVYFAWPSLAWNGSDSLHSQYQMGYELKSDSGWQDLIDLIYTLNFQIEDIETILNVDRALWFFAASTVMPDVDAYTGLYRHNYYLYRNTSSGQFEVIPWDKDQTFGNSIINLVLEEGGNIQWIYRHSPFQYEGDHSRPLFSRLIDIPLYKKIYTAHIRTIIDEIYNVDYFLDFANTIQDSIEPYASNDPNVFESFEGGDYFEYNVDHFMITPDGVRWCGITSTVAPHSNFLSFNSEISKIAPTIYNVNQSVANPSQDDTVWITTEISDAETVELMITINEFPANFISMPMFDDGEHEDGIANDNIYGVSIPFSNYGQHIKYYIRASNDDALVLEPQKAERVFFEYVVGATVFDGTTIVINEINYNSSDDINPDDWVEIYNPLDTDVDISQWVFKDENDDHIFTFADDLSLGSHEYLVLCENSTSFMQFFPEVENYIGDFGFGLSGGGELIRLFDSDGILIDTVTYDNDPPWPPEPDGFGPTLELNNPIAENSDVSNWFASEANGTAGEVNSNFQPSGCSDLAGDVNLDNIIDVLDIVFTIGCIFSGECDNCPDVNDDGNIDVIDIVQLVDIILGD